MCARNSVVGDVWEVLPRERAVVIITDDDYNSFGYSYYPYDAAIAPLVESLDSSMRVRLFLSLRPMCPNPSCGYILSVSSFEVLRNPSCRSGSHVV